MADALDIFGIRDPHSDQQSDGLRAARRAVQTIQAYNNYLDFAILEGACYTQAVGGNMKGTNGRHLH